MQVPRPAKYLKFEEVSYRKRPCSPAMKMPRAKQARNPWMRVDHDNEDASSASANMPRSADGVASADEGAVLAAELTEPPLLASSLWAS